MAEVMPLLTSAWMIPQPPRSSSWRVRGASSTCIWVVPLKDDVGSARPQHGSAARDATRHLESDEDELLITTGLLKIGYDGTFFCGWTVGDDSNNSNEKGVVVRSVRGVLQANLAKYYGNVDPSRIIVEGCSRTDKGVHAVGMVAQFYCLTEDVGKALQSTGVSASVPVDSYYPPGQPSIPGKRLPHPYHSTDSSCFVPLPRRLGRNEDSLTQLTYSLNRMCPEDVQIMAHAPLPTNNHKNNDNIIPFHPTRSAHRKTYRYRFSVGDRHDPTQLHSVWHVGHAVHHPDGDDAVDDKDWTVPSSRVQQACALLQGRHNWSAFRGAPRGPDDKRKFPHQDPFCTLEQVTLQRCTSSSSTGVARGTSAATTYTLEITGDRFLYKMVRFLVGAIVAVGRQQLSLTDLERILTTGDRRSGVGSWECAPPHGLMLYDVQYDNDPPVAWHAATS